MFLHCAPYSLQKNHCTVIKKKIDSEHSAVFPHPSHGREQLVSQALMHLSPRCCHSSSSLCFIFLTIANLPLVMSTLFSGVSRLRAFKTAAPSIHTYPRTLSASFFGGHGYLEERRERSQTICEINPNWSRTGPGRGVGAKA